MQYGAHIYIFTQRWADDQLWVLDTAKKLGLDLVEISVGDDIHFSHQKTREHAEALGLTLTVGPGGTWPLACDLSADEPEHRAKGLAWHKRQVDLCAEVGAVAYAGALYGHPGVIKRRRPPASEYGATAEGLHALADYAGKLGVRIVLEPMSSDAADKRRTPVVKQACVGCGMCEMICPAGPAAIVVEERLTWEIAAKGARA
jgi:sugar phosphate isomerase/epimerase